MATSDWTKLNPKIKVKQTKKRMFGRFYYTVKYFCPGGRVITEDDSDIDAEVQNRREWNRSYNYGGSWRAIKEQLNKISVDQLEAFRVIKLKYGPQIRLRVEEPYITFYGETEEILLEIADHLSVWSKELDTITLTTPEEKELLDRDCILAKVDLGYKYKIILRDGNFKNKQALREYLEGLGTEIKISDGVWRNLGKEYPWLWGAWMYVNDPNVCVMLNIIEPGIVASTHEIVTPMSNIPVLEIDK